MPVTTRCGICQSIFLIVEWTEEYDCTFCGAHRAWTGPDSFEWTRPTPASAVEQRPRGRLFRRRHQTQPA